MGEVIKYEGEGNVIPQGGDFLPVMNIARAIQRRRAVFELVRSEIWVDGVHSGSLPGIDKKMLFQPGAELLCSYFGLRPEFEDVESVEDWTGEEHGGEALFYNRLKCHLYKGETELAEAEGSANSWEDRFRWRWVDEFQVLPTLIKSALVKRETRGTELDWAVKQGRTDGKYGKPGAYWDGWRKAIEEKTARPIEIETRTSGKQPGWERRIVQFRIPNPEVFSLAHTILSQAQKRSLVRVVRLVTNASELFLMPEEEMDDFMAANPESSAANAVGDEGRPGEGAQSQKAAGQPTTEKQPSSEGNGERKKNGKDSPQQQHWSKDSKICTAFWIEAQKHGFTPKAVFEKLGVKSLEEVKVSIEAMRAQLWGSAKGADASIPTPPSSSEPQGPPPVEKKAVRNILWPPFVKSSEEYDIWTGFLKAMEIHTEAQAAREFSRATHREGKTWADFQSLDFTNVMDMIEGLKIAESGALGNVIALAEPGEEPA